MNKRKHCFVCLCAFTLVLSYGAAGHQSSGPVAAVVGDTAIYVSQIDWMFHKKFADRDLDQEVATRLRAYILKNLVEQQLVMEYLKDTGLVATDDEMNLAVQRISEQLRRVDKTLKQFLQEDLQTEYGLRFNLRFQSSWKRYLDRYLTDENLKKFFDSNRRHYDGTQLKVAHLLIAPEEDATDEDIQQALAKAKAIGRQISQGTLSWNQAVKEHSSAPTSNQGGDIGWIKRSGPMPDQFTDVAFELESQQISSPVHTKFGVHLIKCLEIRDGSANWYDVRSELKDGATRFLFDRIVERQRDKVLVRYTGAAAHIDPKTGELVPANRK